MSISARALTIKKLQRCAQFNLKYYTPVMPHYCSFPDTDTKAVIFNAYKYEQLSFKLMTALTNSSGATAHFFPFPNGSQVPLAPYTTKGVR